jgi:hypothetical protein
MSMSRRIIQLAIATSIGAALGLVQAQTNTTGGTPSTSPGSGTGTPPTGGTRTPNPGDATVPPTGGTSVPPAKRDGNSTNRDAEKSSTHGAPTQQNNGTAPSNAQKGESKEQSTQPTKPKGRVPPEGQGQH